MPFNRGQIVSGQSEQRQTLHQTDKRFPCSYELVLSYTHRKNVRMFFSQLVMLKTNSGVGCTVPYRTGEELLLERGQISV